MQQNRLTRAIEYLCTGLLAAGLAFGDIGCSTRQSQNRNPDQNTTTTSQRYPLLPFFDQRVLEQEEYQKYYLDLMKAFDVLGKPDMLGNYKPSDSLGKGIDRQCQKPPCNLIEQNGEFYSFEERPPNGFFFKAYPPPDLSVHGMGWYLFQFGPLEPVEDEQDPNTIRKWEFGAALLVEREKDRIDYLFIWDSDLDGDIDRVELGEHTNSDR